MTQGLLIGVLGLQGDIEENIQATNNVLNEKGLDGTTISVRYPEQIAKVDGLIIPGGESTVMGILMTFNLKLYDHIKMRLNDNLPVLGTCAGMIVLAREAYDSTVSRKKQLLLGGLDIEVERNSFGRQNNSFETNLSIDGIGENFKGVFIRAPSVKSTGSAVEILSKFDDKIVAVKQNNIIGTSFHPELSGDNRLHEVFVESIVSWKKM
jgi:5'-phosphate synthase pdxT subunit